MFKEIYGNKNVIDELIEGVRSNRVSHAQLFLGPQGNEGLPMAMAYATYLLCEDKGEQDSCGKCSACIKANKWIHPDIHFSFPVITRKSGEKTKSVVWIQEWRQFLQDGAQRNVFDWIQIMNDKLAEKTVRGKQGNITTEECHDIISKLSLKAFEGEYKILIMWMPEYLGAAGNILLNLLEEPPEDTVLLLVAQNQDLILNTLKSRTQLVKINRLSDENIIKACLDKFQLGKEEASKIAHLAEGDINEIENLISNADNDNETLLKEILNLAVSNNGIGISKWVDRIASTGRESQKGFIKYLLQILRECVLFKYGNESLLRLKGAEHVLVEKLSSRLDIEKTELLITILNKKHYYIERNAHPKILFFDLTLLLTELLSDRAISDYKRSYTTMA
ncbi:MAG: hypothetical protein IIA45_05550 [Bacteroidetes bacterium]|nr:hypothetical protein [Bacteroidota bacterium]